LQRGWLAMAGYKERTATEPGATRFEEQQSLMRQLPGTRRRLQALRHHI